MKRRVSKKDARLSVFSSTPSATKALRRMYKRADDEADIELLFSELCGQSDRASMILAASFLDDALKYRLSKKFCFIPTDSDLAYCFRFEGPLGTFSSRLEIATLFGVIDDSTYQQLDIIRELRNACAHSKQPISFKTDRIINVVNRLRPPLGLFGVGESSIRGEKIAFAFEVLYLHGTLLLGNRERARVRLTNALKKVIPVIERSEESR